MDKFFVLISTPMATMEEWAKTTDEASRKAQSDKLMQEWNDWMAANAASIVDKGLPLGKTKRVDANGVTDSRNDLNWYLIVQAESPEAAAQLFVNHPHIKTIPGSYIEVMGTKGMGGNM